MFLAELGASTRLYNTLRYSDIEDVGVLLSMSNKELGEIKNMNDALLNELQGLLEKVRGEIDEINT